MLWFKNDVNLFAANLSFETLPFLSDALVAPLRLFIQCSKAWLSATGGAPPKTISPPKRRLPP